MLIPEIAQGAAGELDELRTACGDAVARMLATGPQTVVVVGCGPDDASYRPADHGTFRRYGAGPSVNLGGEPGPGAGELPLSIMVGAWLLGQAGTEIPQYGRGVPPSATTEQCRRIGGALREADGSLGLLVMGDGSARRTEKAPGSFDPRAEAYDKALATALGSADRQALDGLDPALAAELMAGGRAAWQVLAGATIGAGFRGELLCQDAPYGVGYFVASWVPA
ncbi:MAG: class III extradiol dioxygenase subunit B-like domain-containing protein [Micromonosporaceae bacterium]